MKSFVEFLNNKNKNEKVEKPIVEPKITDIKDVKQPEPVMKKNCKVEYVDDQGKLIEKPPVDVKGDYRGKEVKAPEGKGAAPYKAANDDVESPTVKVDKNGLADLGDKKLKYEPDTNVKLDVKITKTENFLNSTKNMSMSEFTNYMLKECGCGCEEMDDEIPYVSANKIGNFHPYPPEAVKYVVVLANKNNNILDNVVREMKNTGMLRKLLQAVMANPEAHEELVSLMNDDESMAKNFKNTLIASEVSSPIGFEDEEEIEMADDSELGSDEPEEDSEDLEDLSDFEEPSDDSDSEEDDEVSEDELDDESEDDYDFDFDEDEKDDENEEDEEGDGDNDFDDDEVEEVDPSRRS